MTTNAERGQRAYDALMHYKKELLIEGGHGIYDETIVDLITDIKHLCDSHEHNFDACLRMATSNYNTERGYYESADSHKADLPEMVDTLGKIFGHDHVIIMD